METFTFPDGSTVQIPSGLSQEKRRQLLQNWAQRLRSDREEESRPIRSRGLASLDTSDDKAPSRFREPFRQTGGNIWGSAWEAVKSIPRGARQFTLMARQGLAGLATPDEDTPYEKELRSKLRSLQEEIDPRYRDAHLPQIGMGLGQVAAMAGTAMIPGIGKPLAISGAALMGAGEASSSLAEYEEETGEDVSGGKEILALAGGLGIGLSEMMPIGRLAGRFARKEAIERAADMGAGKIMQSAFQQAGEEAVQEGLAAYSQSALARALYDPSALNDAGTEALKEAIVGGEVGAIADVLTSLATGRYGRYARGGIEYQANEQLQEALYRRMDKGGVDDAWIENLISGPDIEGIQARRDSREISEEEYQEEMRRAQEIQSLRESIITVDEDGFSQAERTSQRIGREENRKLDALYSSGAISSQERDIRRKEIQSKSTNFYELIQRAKSGIERSMFGEFDKETGEWVNKGPQKITQQAEKEAREWLDKLNSEELTSEEVLANINELNEESSTVDSEIEQLKNSIVEAEWQALTPETRTLQQQQGNLEREKNGLPPNLDESYIPEFLTYEHQLSRRGFTNASRELRRQLARKGDHSNAIANEIKDREEILRYVSGEIEISEGSPVLTSEDLAAPITFKANALIDHIIYGLKRPQTEQELIAEVDSEGPLLDKRRVQLGRLIPELEEKLARDDSLKAQKELEDARAELVEVEEKSDAWLMGEIDAEEYQEQRLEEWRTYKETDATLKLRMTPKQRAVLDRLREKGRETPGDVEGTFTPIEDLTPVNMLNAIEVLVPKESQSKVYRSALGFQVLPNIGFFMEENAIDRKPEPTTISKSIDPTQLLRSQRAAQEKRASSFQEGVKYDPARQQVVLDILRDPGMVDLYTAYRKSNGEITKGVLITALKAKNYAVPDNFFELPIYKGLVDSTLGTNVLRKTPSWEDMNEGQREAIFLRVLQSKTQFKISPDTPEGPAFISRAVLAGRQAMSPLREFKSPVQQKQEIDSLINARERAERWKAAFKERIRRLKMPDVERVLFVVDEQIGTLMDQVEDIVIEGPMAPDVDGVAGFRPAYRQDNVPGAIASLQNYGTQLVFNLSQVEKRYQQGLDTDIDTLIKDATVHEGTHIHVLKDLTDSERRALENYGRKQLVPKEINAEAAELGLTWREHVRNSYSDIPDIDLTEETSVQILDALAQGKISEAKSVGTIGKIQRALVGRFKAVVGASRDVDILPILRVFEGIQNRDILQRRERSDTLVRGAASLQLAERAAPEDLIRLKDAIKEGDQTKIKQVADDIIRSRMEVAKERTKNPTEGLLESLVNDLRARKEVDDTPTHVVSSVLNLFSIDDGTVSPEALDAYFRFRDGRKPAYRMPLEQRESRWGKKSTTTSPAAEEYAKWAKDNGIIGESEPLGEQAVKATEGHNRRAKKGLKGMDQYVGSSEDMDELLTYTRREVLRRKFLDKRLPMWKSSKRAYRNEIKLYETTLGRLAENAAITAWRFADNAMNFLPGVMKFGMLSYVDGGFRLMPLTTGGRKVMGLMDIFRPIIQLGKEAEETTLSYMSHLRVHGVRKNLREAASRIDRSRERYEKAAAEHHRGWSYVDAFERASADLHDAQSEYDEWLELYDNTNPKRSDGSRTFPDGMVEKNGVMVDQLQAQIDRVEQSRDVEFVAAVEFSKNYQDFNYHLVEFAYQTGTIDKKNKDRMQSMPYIPFYRDRGWQDTTPMENQQNEEAEKAAREGKPEEPEDIEASLRGAPLIDKAIRGSFLPIKNDLVGNITKNVQSLIRDGMINVAAGRTMRDEIAGGTAVEIPTVSPEMYRRRRFLERHLLDQTLDVNERARLEQQQTNLVNEIRRIERDAADINRRLDKEGFSTIVVKARGVTEEVYQRDVEKIRERLAAERGVDVTEVTDAEVYQATPSRDLGEVTLQSETRIVNNGEQKAYRVMDPELSQSIMSAGFSPMKSIEDFFGKIPYVGQAKVFTTGITKLLTFASRGLREAVTRAPPFQLKNIIRDSLQASVTFGGGPELWLKTLKNAIDPNVVERAERVGLGIAVDWSPDPRDAGKQAVSMVRRENFSWYNPLDIWLKIWDGLGRFARQSEVATRMAVYDTVMEATNGNAAEATVQAMEIINYGRRGASKLGGIITSMSPFLNGRIQGLDVMFRTHVGAMDAPGLFLEEGTEIDSAAQRRFRVAIAARRGAFIGLGTLLYWAMVHDDEEYKNAREDLKNDWWLIPLGGDLPGVKIPIPFEVGTLYKVIPEQMFRMLAEEQHDLRDVTGEVWRQIRASLALDLRPQLVRPFLDAIANKDAFQRDDIVPSWMEDSVAATEQHNPYTSIFARTLADKVAKIPLVGNMDELTSPMKLEYMLRQYTGTLGAYVMVMTDALMRDLTDDNIVGTTADFPLPWHEEGLDRQTIINVPIIGDLLYDPARGGGLQEDAYEIIEGFQRLKATLGQKRKQDFREPLAAIEYQEEHRDAFLLVERLNYKERELTRYREQRNTLMERTDLSDPDKRRMLYRMYEIRDQMLSDIEDIMIEIRKDKPFFEQITGRRYPG